MIESEKSKYLFARFNWQSTINVISVEYRGQELDYIRVPHQPPVLYSRKYDRFIQAQDALMYLPIVSPRGGFLVDDVGLGMMRLACQIETAFSHMNLRENNRNDIPDFIKSTTT